MKRRAGCLAVALFLAVCVVGADEAGLKEKCSNDFPKVVECLDFATGKVSSPSKGCCNSIKDIKDSKPECLCFIIQQTHDGSQQIKDLGIQEAKLLQLPSACNLKNSNVSYCPKLLGISPNSPDAAIFSNSSSPTAPTTATKSTGPSGSSGNKILPQHTAGLTAIAIAFLFAAAFPATPAAFHA